MDRVDALEKVAFLAGLVVLEAPVKSHNSFQSYVRRDLIAEIEVALGAAGYNMQDARKRMVSGMNVRKRKDEKGA